jgi:hypothetical protein
MLKDKLLSISAIAFVFILSLCINQSFSKTTTTLFSLHKHQNELQESNNFVKDAVFLQLDKTTLTSIISEKNQILDITIPLNDDKYINMNLKRIDIYSPTAQCMVSKGNEKKKFDFRNRILTYKGTVDNDPQAIVSLTFSENSVMGMILKKNENYVIGKYGNDDKSSYVLYQNEKVLDFPPLICGTSDKVSDKLQNIIYDAFRKYMTKDDSMLGLDTMTVELAFDSDYRNYTHFKKDTLQIFSYFTALTAVGSLIYERDVKTRLQLNYVNVWASEDPPYPYKDQDYMGDMQKYWEANMTNVKRDVTMFLTVRDTAFGGVAYSAGGLCEGINSYAICGMNGNFAEFPAYSYDEYVLSHELGHVVGSMHTHNCSWPLGPIDSCSSPEVGTCSNNYVQTLGTIMSYCTKIDLHFHPFCAAVIRSCIERASCVGSPDNAQYIYSLKGRLTYKGNPISNLTLHIVAYNEGINRGTPDPGGSPDAVTDADGNYIFTRLAGGLYKVDPPDEYFFEPRYSDDISKVYVVDTIVIRNFDLNRAFPISGTMSGAENDSINVLVVHHDSSSGYPSFDYGKFNDYKNFRYINGTYTLIPYTNHYSFTPNTRTVVINEAQVTGINFTAQKSEGYQIWGTAMLRSQPNVYQNIGNIDIVLNNAEGVANTTKSDSSGFFVFDNIKSGDYICTIKDLDTSSYVLISNSYNQEIKVDTTNPYSPAIIIVKERKFPLIANKYFFSKDQTNYIEFIGDIIATGSNTQSVNELITPFGIRFGDSVYNKLTVSGDGFVSFGYTDYLYSNPISSNGWSDGIISPFGTSMYSTSNNNLLTSLRYKIEGQEPNRNLIIQWKDFIDFDYVRNKVIGIYNFQLKLAEDGNTIEFIYGDCSYDGGTKEKSAQIGLRGSDTLDINSIRVNYNNPWDNPIPGKYASDSVILAADFSPQSGLVYRWSRFTDVNQKNANNITFGLSLHPSIASDLLNIDYHLNAAVYSQLEIINEYGEKVYSRDKEFNSFGDYSRQISLGNLLPGVYFCKLTAGNQAAVRKFVVVK